MVFLSPSRRMPKQFLKIRSRSLSSKSVPSLHLLTTISFNAI
jgi:hypothetical protein